MCTSDTASSVEMAGGVVDQVENQCGDGFLAYDGNLHEEVFVIPSILYIIADTPMASTLCCVMQSAANHPCRQCHVSSKMENAEDLQTWFQVKIFWLCTRMATPTN